MANKIYRAPKYWSTKPIDPLNVIVTRYEHVQHRAGVQGMKIGVLGIGARLVVDLNEKDEGDVRIVSIDGFKPIPLSWEEPQLDKAQEEREWWVDTTGVAPVGTDASQITLVVMWDDATNSGTVKKV